MGVENKKTRHSRIPGSTCFCAGDQTAPSCGQASEPPSIQPMGQRLPRLTPCLPQVPRQSMSAWGRSMPGTVPTASAEVQPATAWCPVLVQMWARACMHVHTCVHPRRQCPPCPSPPASPSMCKWGAHLQPPPNSSALSPILPSAPKNPACPGPRLLPCGRFWCPRQHWSHGLQPPLSSSGGRAPAGGCAAGWAGSRACGSGPCSGTPSRLETPTTSARGSGMSGWPVGRGR